MIEAEEVQQRGVVIVVMHFIHHSPVAEFVGLAVDMAALEAAAHPSSEKYLYFVSKMDGSGKSKFSHDLNEHNAAVREFILKKK